MSKAIWIVASFEERNLIRRCWNHSAIILSLYSSHKSPNDVLREEEAANVNFLIRSDAYVYITFYTKH
jgi:hypothetical protein